MTVEYIEYRTCSEDDGGRHAPLRHARTPGDVVACGWRTREFSTHHAAATFPLENGARGLPGHRVRPTCSVSRMLENLLPDLGIVYDQQGLNARRPGGPGATLTAQFPERMRHGGRVMRFDDEPRKGRGKRTLDSVAPVPTDLVRPHRRFDALFAAAAALGPVPTAVVHPVDPFSLQAAIETARDGLIRPILVGPAARIRAVADQFGIDLGAAELIDVAHSHAAAARAVALIREGRARILLTGSLHNDELLCAVRDQDQGLRTERRLSHVFVIDLPTYPKLLLVSDAVINLVPALTAKADICRNAIDLARTLGQERPKVAILSAVETIRPDDPSTLDAAALCKMAERGQIQGGILRGPVTMDTVIDPETERIKKIGSAAFGVADILIVPDRESGTLLARRLTFMTDAEAAAIVLGARVPIVLTSRADSRRIRRAAVGIAVLQASAARRRLDPRDQ